MTPIMKLARLSQIHPGACQESGIQIVDSVERPLLPIKVDSDKTK